MRAESSSDPSGSPLGYGGGGYGGYSSRYTSSKWGASGFVPSVLLWRPGLLSVTPSGTQSRPGGGAGTPLLSVLALSTSSGDNGSGAKAPTSFSGSTCKYGFGMSTGLSVLTVTELGDFVGYAGAEMVSMAAMVVL